MARLRKLWSNEYFKSLIFLIIVLSCIVAFWFGLRAVTRTAYPLLAVASGSMEPILNVGDLIIVQGGQTVESIQATPNTGDIIVFQKPQNPDELIVHRAVDKITVGNTTYLETKGDANSGNDPWKIYDSNLVGKVVFTVPYVGHIPLFVHTREGMLIIIILIVVLVLLEFVIPSAKKKIKSEEPKEERSDEETFDSETSPA